MRCSIPHIVLGFVALWGVACSSPSSSTPVSDRAQYFALTDSAGWQRLDIYDPWHAGKRLNRYYLIDSAQTHAPADGIAVCVPIHRLALSSATHVGFITALRQSNRIVALTTPERIYNTPAQPVVSIGEDIQLHVEALLMAHPDALIVSSYGSPNPSVDRAAEMGVPIITLVEWMEVHPVARAEWIRVFGALTGTLPQADSIWNQVRLQYHHIRLSHQTDSLRPSVVSGLSFRGTWYVPGAKSYMGQLLLDAGADYALAHQDTEGSIPFTMEQILHTFSQADVWVGCSANSLTELAQLDDKHTWMKAYQNHRVYSFSARTTVQGANDFWETGAVHPEYILQDLQHVLYPPADSSYHFTFIAPLLP